VKVLYCRKRVVVLFGDVHLLVRLGSGRHADRQSCTSYSAHWQIFVIPYLYKLPLHCMVTFTSRNFLRKVVSFPCSLLVNLTDLANIPCLMLTGLAVVSHMSCSSQRMWFVNSLGTRSFSCN